jgi:hypothetical protein
VKSLDFRRFRGVFPLETAAEPRMTRVSGHIAQILRKKPPQPSEKPHEKIVAMMLANSMGRH